MKLDTIEIITLFVPDIDKARTFYASVFDAEIIHSDPVSAVLAFKGTMINLLDMQQTDELLAPLTAAKNGAGMLLTVRVDDVDAECARLEEKGVSLVNGPIDRSWGRRTVCFADPGGNLWEFAQIIE